MNNEQINESNQRSQKSKMTVVIISVIGVVLLLLACIFLFKTPTKVSFVTYSPNLNIPPVTIDKETGTIDFPEDPVRNGFYFTGWYTNKELTNKWDKEQDKFVKKNSLTGNYEKDSSGNYILVATTLYAGWEVDIIEINYELNGGVNHSKNPANYTIKHEPTDADISKYGTYDNAAQYTLVDRITLETPHRSGYTFDGWYTDANFSTRVYSIDRVSITEVDKTVLKTGVNGIEYYGHKPLTLYAKWIQN